MSNRVLIAMTLTSCLIAHTAHAYDVETHKDVSKDAFNASTVSMYVSTELYVDPAQEYEAATTIPPVTDRRPLVNWVRQGAEDEDDNLTLSLHPTLARYRHHFYNPLDGSGLHYFGISGLPSPTWGIEFQPISGQDFSFIDGRRYFYAALTATGRVDREHSLVQTFVTLGHIIHLVSSGNSGRKDSGNSGRSATGDRK